MIGRMMPAARTEPLHHLTAICERCGCTWDNACPGGCAWDQEAWAQGKALCTACAAKPPAPTSASVVSALTDDQMLELMRQHPRTTVAEFRATLEAALDLAGDRVIEHRIGALTGKQIGDFARHRFSSYDDDSIRAVLLVTLAPRLTKEGGHG